MTMNGSRNRVKFLNIYTQCDSLKLQRYYFFRALYEQLEIPLTVARQPGTSAWYPFFILEIVTLFHHSVPL